MTTYAITNGAFPETFRPGRGFASELAAALTLLQPCEADPIRNHLLTDQGDGSRYAKVAPQAAAMRPMRPIVWQLRRWAEAGLVTITVTTDAPEAPAAEADADKAPEAPPAPPAPAPKLVKKSKAEAK